MRVHRLGIAIGLMGSMLWAPAALAAPPPVTTITIDVTFGGPETFTATGDVVCDSGTAVSGPTIIAGGGRRGGGVLTFHVVKTLTCADGTGTFKLLVDVAASRTSPGRVGGFAAGQGTGEHAGLHGGGQLVGTARPDGSGVTDVYTGILHIG